jgi:hypothetical protein
VRIGHAGIRLEIGIEGAPGGVMHIPGADHAALGVTNGNAAGPLIHRAIGHASVAISPICSLTQYPNAKIVALHGGGYWQLERRGCGITRRGILGA